MKISVIIPVYNTKEYLVQCLDSVLNQSLKNIEILLVDDGSDDGSYEIIRSYEEKHANIRAFQQVRKRQGAARNLALEYASGEFIAFLDSDDTVPRNAYEKMYEMAQENLTDMVIGVQQSFSRLRRWVGVPVHREHFHNSIKQTGIIDFPALLSDISACNKLFRRSKLTETGILFPEQKSGEDLDFMARVYLEFHGISILPEVVYNYRARENASTGRIKSAFFRDRVTTTLMLHELYGLSGRLVEFQFLLRSEIRKLVGNRLAKVFHNLPEKERIQIIDYIRSLTNLIEYETFVISEDVSSLDKVKIILLKEGELDALYHLVGNENDEEFLKIIESSHCAESVRTHWNEYKRRESKLLSRKKIKRFLRPKYYLGKRIIKAIVKGNFAGLYCVFKYLILDFVFLFKEKKVGCSQKAWIIDERWAQSAEDNSLHFFIHLRTHFPQLPVFYVIKKNSPQLSNVESYGNVVPLFSWRHLQLLHSAEVLISTDGFKALAFPFEFLPFLRRKTFNVFLQHGVSGNKTMTYYKERHPYFDMVVTSNEKERRSFIDVYGFAENEVVVTGIARFDKLPAERKECVIRRILVAPTWRKWLVGKYDIKKSSYYRVWSGLLTSRKFIEILENHNVQLTFQPHFNMMKYIHNFEGHSTHIQIITEPDELLQKHIIESDMLITDYSSVMYDFFYQHKPVYSIMFDRAEWEKPPNGPPLIDFERDLPLTIFENFEQLIQMLGKTIAGDIMYGGNDLQKVTRLFKYRDHDNCKRIHEHIIGLKN